MKLLGQSLHWHLLLALVVVLGSAAMGAAPASAQTGTVISSATASNAAPGIGEQIVVTINIDMSGANAPDNMLGSFTGTLGWNPAVLAYSSDSGVLAGFTGLVNTTQATAGHVTFNGANAMGAAGNIVVLNITFDVVGAGSTALDVEYSVMAATGTFASLLTILTVKDGQVVVGSAGHTPTPEPTPVASPTATVPSSTETPTATAVPTATNTPVAPTRTPVPSSTPPDTISPTATSAPTVAPIVTPTPTQRYWTYLSLLLRGVQQEHPPFLSVTDWKCIVDSSACCTQPRVAPRLPPRLPPFCGR